MIKAVIFDYGNVISQPATGAAGVGLEKLSGVPAAVFNSVYERFRFEFDRGTINGAEMYRQLLTEDGYTDVAKDSELLKKLARYDLESWWPILQDVSDWALSLKKDGYKLGILSNMPYEFLDLYEKEIPPFVEADFACFSCRVKLIKPEPEIYMHTLKGLGVQPEEAVFFDDIQENIDAACALGIHGFVWTGLDKGKKDLAQCIRENS
ncbi:MAG: HAD family phosphatase [Spirochaetales bacterium]